MADEPERRLVGAIHAELSRQADQDLPGDLIVDLVESDGTCSVNGTVDLYLLARAILEEQEPCTCARILRGNLDHRCSKHPDVRPKTQEEKAAFAHAWDAKVEQSRNG